MALSLDCSIRQPEDIFHRWGQCCCQPRGDAFLAAPKPDGSILPLELCLSEGLSCAGDTYFSQCWGLSPVAPHDHFCAVPHCLQQTFLPPCQASCPVNCSSHYVKCIILYIVLTFALWKPLHISQNTAEFHRQTNLVHISSNSYFHSTCRRNSTIWTSACFVYCLNRDHKSLLNKYSYSFFY